MQPLQDAKRHRLTSHHNPASPACREGSLRPGSDICVAVANSNRLGGLRMQQYTVQASAMAAHAEPPATCGGSGRHMASGAAATAVAEAAATAAAPGST